MSKLAQRQKIRYRIRKKVQGTASKPRLSVFRSNAEIYCQLIDDDNGVTLACFFCRKRYRSAKSC
jgi:large subunit ribosomal protein L18